ncbi:hydrolase, partial [Levilactobacillus brevis]|nr:hydrolase [Levilactobacillus brevis]
GDIKTPVKYATPELRKMLADVEDSLTANFIQNEIPSQFQAAYTRRLGEGKDETLEGQILSVADKVDLLYESFVEIQKGNPEPVFTEIYRESLTTILKFKQLACVQYFLAEVLPEMLAADFSDRQKLAQLTNQLLEEPSK